MPLPAEYVRKREVATPVTPWVSATMLIIMLFLLYQSQGHGLLWLKFNSFCPGKFDLYLTQHQYWPMINNMFFAAFCPANIWAMLGNAYFLWVFGSTVELRLGTSKYLSLIAVCLFGGWLIQAYAAGFTSQGLFVGPSLLTAGVIGAYMIFFPEKKINPGGSIGRSTKFFKNEPDPDPSAAFGVSPWWLLIAFVAYQSFIHFMLWNLPVRFDNMTIVAGVGTFLTGLASCGILVAAAAHGVSGNPLKILAIQRYRQLRALDLSHDDAVDGTARLMSCPVEQVREWIAKGSGALPTQPTA